MKNLFHFRLNYKRSLIVTIVSISFIISFAASAVVYGINQRRLQNFIVEKNSSMQQQLVNTVDAVFAEIDRILIQYSLHRTVNDYVFKDIESSEDYRKVSELITDITNSKTASSLIYSIDVLYPHKKFVISNSTYWMTELKELHTPDVDFYEELLNSENSYNIVKRQKYNGGSSTYKNVISVSRYFEKGMYGGVTVIVNIDMNGLMNTVREVCQDIDLDYFVLKDNDILLANSDATVIFIDNISQAINLQEELQSKDTIIQFEDTKYHVITSYMKFGRLKYGLIIPSNDIKFIQSVFDYKMVIIFLIILFFCIIIGWISSSFLYKPVRGLVSELNQMPGQTDKIQQKGFDDFSFIRNRFTLLTTKNDEIEGILSRNMPLIKRSFLLNLVEGKVKTEDAFNKFDMYGITLHERYFSIIVMKVEFETGKTEFELEETVSLIIYKIGEELAKQPDIVYKYSLFELDNKKICMILNYAEKMDGRKNVLFQFCKYIQEIIIHFFKSEMTIAVGKETDCIEQLAGAYKTAKALVDQAYLFERGQILLFDDNIPEKSENTYFPLEEGNAIVRAVKNCDKNDVSDTLSAMKEKVNRNIKQSDLQFILPQSLSGVIHAIIEAESTNPHVIDEVYRLIQSKKELFIPINTIHVEKYFSELEDLFFKLIENRQNRILEKNRELVKKAVEYIDERFTENITVENIADYLCISAGHLSRVFKSIKDITVMEYMVEKKLKYAMELLQDTDTQIQDISQKVGYNCSRTFIRAFKIRYGTTPGQVREGKT